MKTEGIGSSDNMAITQMQIQDYANIQTAGTNQGNSGIASMFSTQLGGLLGVSGMSGTGMPALGDMGGLMGMMNPLAGLGNFFNSQSMPMQMGGFRTLPPVGMNIGLGMSLAGMGFGGFNPLLSMFGFGGTGQTGGTGFKLPRTSENPVFLSSSINKFANNEYKNVSGNIGFPRMGGFPFGLQGMSANKLFLDDKAPSFGGVDYNGIKGKDQQAKFTADMTGSLVKKLKYEERRDYKELTSEAFAESYAKYLKSKNPSIDEAKMTKALTKALTDPNFGSQQQSPQNPIVGVYNMGAFGGGFGGGIYGGGGFTGMQQLQQLDPDLQYLRQNGITNIGLFKEFVGDMSNQIKDQVAKDNMGVMGVK